MHTPSISDVKQRIRKKTWTNETEPGKAVRSWETRDVSLREGAVGQTGAHRLPSELQSHTHRATRHQYLHEKLKHRTAGHAIDPDTFLQPSTSVTFSSQTCIDFSGDRAFISSTVSTRCGHSDTHSCNSCRHVHLRHVQRRRFPIPFKHRVLVPQLLHNITFKPRFRSKEERSIFFGHAHCIIPLQLQLMPSSQSLVQPVSPAPLNHVRGRNTEIFHCSINS